MTARTFLVVVNLASWLLLLALREPMRPSYFAERDEWHKSGTFHFSSADPPLVIAGRPLWSWSPYHGGESLPVKALELVNLPPLVAAYFASTVFFLLGCPAYTSSILTCGTLLVLSSAQWWLCGLGLERFRSGRTVSRA